MPALGSAAVLRNKTKGPQMYGDKYRFGSAFICVYLCLLILPVFAQPIPYRWTEIALSPDGRQFVALDASGVSIIDAASKKSHVILPAGRVERGLMYAPDGKSLYFIGRENPKQPTSLHRYTFENGALKKVLNGVDGPFAVSPDGQRMVLVQQDKVA